MVTRWSRLTRTQWFPKDEDLIKIETNRDYSRGKIDKPRGITVFWDGVVVLVPLVAQILEPPYIALPLLYLSLSLRGLMLIRGLDPATEPGCLTLLRHGLNNLQNRKSTDDANFRVVKCLHHCRQKNGQLLEVLIKLIKSHCWGASSVKARLCKAGLGASDKGLRSEDSFSEVLDCAKTTEGSLIRGTIKQECKLYMVPCHHQRSA
ncbi:hypothetical protein J6590_017226 [Homalodisca vitripennis]|nr:hypothetical protein J6590_017226 [Homalodisca vitripennis]